MPDIRQEAIDRGLPLDIVLRVVELYEQVAHAPDLVGDSDVVADHWIETHTLGCRNAGGDPEDQWWEAHYEFYNQYLNDGQSIVLGDPELGVFVTITPQRMREPTPEKVSPARRRCSP